MEKIISLEGSSGDSLKKGLLGLCPGDSLPCLQFVLIYFVSQLWGWGDCSWSHDSHLSQLMGHICRKIRIPLKAPILLGCASLRVHWELKRANRNSSEFCLSIVLFKILEISKAQQKGEWNFYPVWQLEITGEWKCIFASTRFWQLTTLEAECKLLLLSSKPVVLKLFRLGSTF